MRLPRVLQRKVQTNDDDDDDVEKVIFQNLWKYHKLLPPRSPKKAYWDAVRSSSLATEPLCRNPPAFATVTDSPL